MFRGRCNEVMRSKVMVSWTRCKVTETIRLLSSSSNMKPLTAIPLCYHSFHIFPSELRLGSDTAVLLWAQGSRSGDASSGQRRSRLSSGPAGISPPPSHASRPLAIQLQASVLLPERLRGYLRLSLGCWEDSTVEEHLPWS